MNARAVILVLLPIVAAATALAAAAQPSQSLEARVVGIVNGDTLTVLDGNYERHKIRLAGIDAPEKGQPFGEQARQRLARTLHGKDVRIEWDWKDHKGRLVAKLWVAPPDDTCPDAACLEDDDRTLDVGLDQLAAGLAWHSRRYANEQSEEDRRRYASAEQQARARKAGLWSEPDPVPPWDWRHGANDGPVKESVSQLPSGTR